MAKKLEKVWEFGDFQTPRNLATEAVTYLQNIKPNFSPQTIIEPTCGVGSFLLSAANHFPTAPMVVGCEIDHNYVDVLTRDIESRGDTNRFTVMESDFFKYDWKSMLADAPRPLLVIGNPPWVTSADIGRLKGSNLPEKSNFQKYSGLEAVTGKANFDISEWMLIHLIEWMSQEGDCLAMLCKSSVARKVLKHAWKNGQHLTKCSITQINAMKHFGAAVDACFFVVTKGNSSDTKTCAVYENFDSDKPIYSIGFVDGVMLSNADKFSKYRAFYGSEKNYTWRSGVKHDCSKVMELKISGNCIVNGDGESVDIEETFKFPLLKSSDLGNRQTDSSRYYMLVTQKKVGGDTSDIRQAAPKTWLYLLSNSDKLDARGSIIYKNNPRFSVFGVGDYTFSQWKVAISGFYKKLEFQTVGPMNGKPVVFDDTVYFLSAETKEEAEFLCSLLNSEPCQNFLSSMVFWDEKRPITAEILKRLNIRAVAEFLEQSSTYDDFNNPVQRPLFREPTQSLRNQSEIVGSR